MLQERSHLPLNAISGRTSALELFCWAFIDHVRELKVSIRIKMCVFAIYVVRLNAAGQAARKSTVSRKCLETHIELNKYYIKYIRIFFCR